MRQEKYGSRDLTFSQWHRTLSDACTAIDLDFIEYCNSCKAPLALIETARDVGQYKPTTILKGVAERTGVKAYLILWQKQVSLDLLDCPACGGSGKIQRSQIGQSRVKRIHPNGVAIESYSPEQLAAFMEAIHANCRCRRNRATT